MSTLLIPVLFVSNPNIAFSSNPSLYQLNTKQPRADSSSLDLPAQYGRVESSFGDVKSATSQKPFVVYFQDAHGNIEGQKNIIELVRYIQSKWPEKASKITFLLEGSVGGLDSTTLRSSKDLKEDALLLQRRVEKGEVSAPAFLATVEAEKFVFFPLEDGPVYKADLIAFQESLLKNGKAIERLKKYRLEIEQLIPKIFSKDALELYRKIQIRQSRSDKILGHVQELRSKLIRIFETKGGQDPEKVAAEFHKTFPALETLLDLAAQEKAMDLSILEKEMTAFDPQQVGSPQEKKDRLLKEYLKAPDAFQTMPHLKAYLDMELERRSIRVDAFFNELGRLEGLMLRLVARSTIETKLMDLMTKLELIDRLLHLRLSRADWIQIKNNPKALLSSKWLLQIAELEKFLKTAPALPSQEFTIDEAVRRSSAFYVGAEKRDEIFQEKLREALLKNTSPLVFLLTGGFHTEPLAHFLETEKIPHMVVSPRLDDFAKGEEIYLSAMKSLKLFSIRKYDQNEKADIAKIIPVSFEPDAKRLFLAASLGGFEPKIPAVDRLSLTAAQFQKLLDSVSGMIDHSGELAAGGNLSFGKTTDQLVMVRDRLKDAGNAFFGHEGQPSAEKVAEGIFLYGLAAYGLDEFYSDAYVEALREDVEARLRSPTPTPIGGDPIMLQKYQQLSELYKIVRTSSSDINELIQKSKFLFHVREKQIAEREKGLRGRLVIIPDINSEEGQRALRNVQFEDILVLKDIPDRELLLTRPIGGIILTSARGDSTHAGLAAAASGVPLLHLPMGDVYLRNMDKKEVILLPISGKDEFLIGTPDQFEGRPYTTGLPSGRKMIAAKGTFGLHLGLNEKEELVRQFVRLGKHKVWEGGRGDPSLPPANLRLLSLFASKGNTPADFIVDPETGDLWIKSHYEIFKSGRPEVKPFAKAGEFYPHLVDARAIDYKPLQLFQYDLEGRVWRKADSNDPDGGNPIPNPFMDKTDSIDEKDCRISPLTGDLIAVRMTSLEGIFYPRSVVKGPPLIPLAQAFQLMAGFVGVKAFNLSLMAVHGVRVPPNIVQVTLAAYQDFKGQGGHISPAFRRSLLRAVYDQFGGKPVVARSSTTLEDLLLEPASGTYDSKIARPIYLTPEAVRSAMDDKRVQKLFESLSPHVAQSFREGLKTKGDLSIISSQNFDLYQQLVDVLKARAFEEKLHDSNFLNTILEEPFLNELKKQNDILFSPIQTAIRDAVRLESSDPIVETLRSQYPDSYEKLVEAIHYGLLNEGLLYALEKVWRSIDGPKATALRRAHGVPDSDVLPGSPVSGLIFGKFGGTIRTAALNRHDINTFSIHLVRGGPGDYVEGEGDPVELEVDILRHQIRTVRDRSTVSTYTIEDRDGNPVEVSLSLEQMTKPVLSESDFEILYNACLEARRIRDIINQSSALEIEFIVDKKDQAYFLQARPIPNLYYDIRDWSEGRLHQSYGSKPNEPKAVTGSAILELAGEVWVHKKEKGEETRKKWDGSPEKIGNLEWKIVGVEKVLEMNRLALEGNIKPILAELVQNYDYWVHKEKAMSQLTGANGMIIVAINALYGAFQYHRANPEKMKEMLDELEKAFVPEDSVLLGLYSHASILFFESDWFPKLNYLRSLLKKAGKHPMDMLKPILRSLGRQAPGPHMPRAHVLSIYRELLAGLPTDGQLYKKISGFYTGPLDYWVPTLYPPSSKQALQQPEKAVFLLRLLRNQRPLFPPNIWSEMMDDIFIENYSAIPDVALDVLYDVGDLDFYRTLRQKYQDKIDKKELQRASLETAVRSQKLFGKGHKEDSAQGLRARVSMERRDLDAQIGAFINKSDNPNLQMLALEYYLDDIEKMYTAHRRRVADEQGLDPEISPDLAWFLESSFSSQIRESLKVLGGGQIENLKKNYAPDNADLMPYFNKISEHIDSWMKSEVILQKNLLRLQGFSDLLREIDRLIEAAERAERVAVEKFDFSHIYFNALNVAARNMKALLGGLTKLAHNRELLIRYKEFNRAFKEAEEFLRNISDTTRPNAAFLETTPSPLKHSDVLFKNYRETQHYLDYTKKNADRLKKVIDAIGKMSDPALIEQLIQSGTTERTKTYLRGLPEHFVMLQKFLQKGYEYFAYSPEERAMSGAEQMFPIEPTTSLKMVDFLYRFSSSESGENIEFKIEVPEKLPEIQCPYPYNAMFYIFVRLMANSVEAIQRTPRYIEIEKLGSALSNARQTQNSAEAARLEGLLEEKMKEKFKITLSALLDVHPTSSDLVIRLTDNGIGIRPEDMPKIYRPDYSTKRVSGAENYSRDTATGAMRSPYGGGLSTVKQIVEEGFRGTIEHGSLGEGRGAEAIVRIPIVARSMGSSTEQMIEESLTVQFPYLDAAKRKELAAAFLKAMKERANSAAAAELKEPSLLVAEADSTDILPNDLGRYLGEKGHLVLVSFNHTDAEWQTALSDKYPDFPNLIKNFERRLVVKGLKGIANPSAELDKLASGWGNIFGSRVGVAVSEKERNLLSKISRLSFAQRIQYSDRAPRELVLPLSFQIVASEGKISDDLRIYAYTNDDGKITIVSLDEMLKLFAIQKLGLRLLSAAA